MATKIEADGTTTEVHPAGTTFTLAELYVLIGCDIVQMVPLADGSLMWCDEEGKFSDPLKPVNGEASRLLLDAGGQLFDLVHGTVIVERGETA